MTSSSEIQRKVTVTKEMVKEAREFFINNFKTQSRMMLWALAERNNAEVPGNGNSVDDIALSVSWHNAGVEAIRILIGEAVFIPITENHYKPRGSYQLNQSSGSSRMMVTHFESFDVSNLFLPVCEELAIRPSGL